MSNLFKKGFASLALASAMASGVFAGNAANVDFKKVYQLEIPLHVIESDNENTVAFKMNIKNSKIIATFDKSAGQTDSEIVNLFLSKKVAGERIEDGNILLKKLKASGKNLMPNIVDKKIGKLTFAINQTDRANMLIISAASKKDLIAAMPIKVALSRIDKKMRLDVTRDRIGFKDKNTIHLFANNVNWDKWSKKKEKVILGNFKKQKAMTPNLNLLSDTSEGTTDKNITNANLLIKSNEQAGEAVKSLASSVIRAKDSVVATTTVGTAANNTYIINANSDLDVNNSGKALASSVIHAKDWAVTTAATIIKDTNTDINSTSSNVNTGSNISFAKSTFSTFINKFNIENGKIHEYAGATYTTDLEANTTTTTANANVANMNNTKNTKINTYANSAYFSFNSNTIGAANIAFHNGEFKIMTHYNFSA